MSGKDVKKLLTQYPIMSRDRILFHKAGEAFEDLDAVYTPEDLWVRYVETTGDDNNDGKSVATAYKTIGKAISELPFLYNVAIIKIGNGTFVENIELSTLSSLYLVGSFTEIYTKATINSAGDYVQHGTNTPAGWTEIVLTEDGSEPITWDDTLKEYYVEFLSSNGRYYRAKILSYNAGAKRLYVDTYRGFSTTIGATPQIVKIVKIGTKIQGAANLSKSVVYCVSANHPGYSTYTADAKVIMRGIMLHGLWIDGVSTGGSYSLLIAGKTSVGDIRVENAKSSGIAFSNFEASTVATFSFYNAPSNITSICDPRCTNNSAGFFNLNGNSGTGTFTISGSMNLISFYWIGSSFTDNHIYIPASKNSDFGSLWVNGRIAIYHSEVGISGKVTVQFIRNYGNGIAGTKSLMSINVAGSKSVWFIGTPSTNYGRIYLAAGAELSIAGPLDCGDLTGHTAGVPVIFVGRNAILHVAGAVTCGTNGAACPSLASMLKVDNGGQARFSALATFYHAPSIAFSAATVLVDNNSSLICEATSKNLEIHTTSALSSGTGAITIDGQSTLHCADDVEVYHTVNTGTGHGLLVSESDAYIEGNYTSTTTLTGPDTVCSSGRLRIDGAVTQDVDGSSLDVSGEASAAKIGGALTVTSCGTMAPVFKIDVAAKGTFMGDCRCPSADYGNGTAIWKMADGAVVYFGAALTDGDGTYNRNTNSTAGYGMEIRRHSHVSMYSQTGPDGTTGDTYLGSKGLTAYPAASASDVVNTSEAAAELCTIVKR